jgi:hypothetical protein
VERVHHHLAEMRVILVLAGFFLLLAGAIASVPQIEIKASVLLQFEKVLAN